MSVKVAYSVGLALAALVLAGCGGDRGAGPPRPIDLADELQQILDQAVTATNEPGGSAEVAYGPTHPG